MNVNVLRPQVADVFLCYIDWNQQQCDARVGPVFLLSVCYDSNHSQTVHCRSNLSYDEIKTVNLKKVMNFVVFTIVLSLFLPSRSTKELNYD